MKSTGVLSRQGERFWSAVRRAAVVSLVLLMLTSCWDLFGPWRNAADPYSQYKAELVASTDSMNGLMTSAGQLSVIPGVGVACYCSSSSAWGMYQFSKSSSGWAAPTDFNLPALINGYNDILGPDGNWYYFVTTNTQGAYTYTLTRLVPPSTTTTLFTTNPAAYTYIGGMAVKADGTVFFSVIGDFKIYKVTSGGVESVYAGTGTQGAAGAGDGGSAISAALCGPGGMALDVNGNLFFVDNVGWATTTNGGTTQSDTILRKIDTSGKLSTVAFNGSGTPSNGDGYPAANSSGGLNGRPCLAPDGTLFWYGGAQVFEIATDGNIYQIAGDIGNATSTQDWSKTSWDYASDVVFGKDSTGASYQAWVSDIAYDSTLGPTGILYVLNGSYNQSTQKSAYRIIALSKR